MKSGLMVQYNQGFSRDVKRLIGSYVASRVCCALETVPETLKSAQQALRGKIRQLESIQKP